MPNFYTYTTVDGKIIAIPNISYIDALISDAESGLKQYRIIQQDGGIVTVEHEDEKILKKDRNRLQSKWDHSFWKGFQ